MTLRRVRMAQEAARRAQEPRGGDPATLPLPSPENRPIGPENRPESAEFATLSARIHYATIRDRSAAIYLDANLIDRTGLNWYVPFSRVRPGGLFRARRPDGSWTPATNKRGEVMTFHTHTPISGVLPFSAEHPEVHVQRFATAFIVGEDAWVLTRRGDLL